MTTSELLRALEVAPRADRVRLLQELREQSPDDADAAAKVLMMLDRYLPHWQESAGKGATSEAKSRPVKARVVKTVVAKSGRGRAVR